MLEDGYSKLEKMGVRLSEDGYRQLDNTAHVAKITYLSGITKLLFVI